MRSILRYRAPGRVNLIGEHTDYNDGLVMPVAIDRATRATFAPRGDRVLSVRSASYDSVATIDLDAPGDGPLGTWSDYVRGVAAVLERKGFRLQGADISIATDLPIGAGLSSSAALEVAVGYGLLDQAGHPIDRTALALACQEAEHQFAGTRCGVMDQIIACHGRAGHALMLDTRALEMVWLPVPPGIAVIICNTMTTHVLATDGYNDRRADCEAGVRALAIRLPRIRALRDVTLEDLDANHDALDERVFRRCRHVVTENARVSSAAAALRAGDLDAVGALMRASHDSMRDDFEISTPEVDAMVESALRAEGTIGARLTGGGFGGCTVNLVRAAQAAAFADGVRAGYEAATGRVPEIYTCVASDGAGRDHA